MFSSSFGLIDLMACPLPCKKCPEQKRFWNSSSQSPANLQMLCDRSPLHDLRVGPRARGMQMRGASMNYSAKTKTVFQIPSLKSFYSSVRKSREPTTGAKYDNDRYYGYGPSILIKHFMTAKQPTITNAAQHWYVGFF